MITDKIPTQLSEVGSNFKLKNDIKSLNEAQQIHHGSK
jgi:hypothetical protein